MTPVTPALESALTYAGRGWRVAPIPAGLKHPGSGDWQDRATVDPDTIREWFTVPRAWSPVRADPAGFGVCVVTGAASGVFVVDVDTYKGGGDTLDDIEAEYGRLPDTVEVVTGRGGRHLYFRTPEGVVIPSGGDVLGAGIDVRGEGGQVVAPPTLHPETGTEYEWEASGDPEYVEVAEAPAWLVELVTARPEAAPRRGATGLASGATRLDLDRPGDRFEGETDWAELLAADGWVFHSAPRFGGGYELWTRPGKDPRDGASASLYYKGSDVLKVFTPNAPGLVAGNTYTRFGYYTATRYNGDHAAAGRALRSVYKPADKPATPRGTPLPTVATSTPDALAEWEATEPEPLGETNPRPPFPLDAFPDWIAAQARQAADELQMTPDLPAMLAVTALSIVAAGRADVEVQGTWAEPLNTYTVTALPPGAGKSPAVKAMTGPLEDWEAELAERAAEQTVKVAMKRRMLEASLKKLEAQGVDKLAEALALQDEISGLPDEVVPRLMADDITPEKIPMRLAEQGGRLAIVSTEGGLFSMMTGRYSDKANLDVYLQAWSRDTIRVDRVGRGDFVVRNPHLTIGITVQPSVIAALASNPELQGRGLTARFMYAIPPDRVGRRDLRRASTWNRRIAALYANELVQLARRLHADPEAPCQSMVLSDEARAVFLDWRQDHEIRMRPDGNLRHMAEWVTKLQSTVARLAGLLHLADHNEPTTPISGLTMARAIRVGNYWEAHARLAHELWGADPTTAKARHLLDWVGRMGLASFTTRDAHRANRRAFPKVDDMVPALTMLAENGWILPLTEGALAVGQRGATKAFRVHPEALRRGAAAELSTVHPEGELSPMSPSPGSTPADRGEYLTESEDNGCDRNKLSPMSPMSLEADSGLLTYSLSTDGGVPILDMGDMGDNSTSHPNGSESYPQGVTARRPTRLPTGQPTPDEGRSLVADPTEIGAF